MTWLSRCKGHLLNTFVLSPFGRQCIAWILRQWQRVLFLMHNLPQRRPNIVVVQLDDPYGYLMVQLLCRANQDATKNDKDNKLLKSFLSSFQILLIGPPDIDVNPEPDLAKAYYRRDCCLLSSFYGLEFPKIEDIAAYDSKDPSKQQFSKQRAQSILLCASLAASGYKKDSISSNNIMHVTNLCCRAWWFQDPGPLEDALRDVEGFAEQPVTPEKQGNLLRANERLLRLLWHYRPGALLIYGEWIWGIDRFLRHLERNFGYKLLETANKTKIPFLQPKIEISQNAPKQVDFFFSFRSPYSYLALVRIKEVCERHGLLLNIRLVLPMVLRGLPVPFCKKLFIILDCAKEAQHHKIPFGIVCDPLPGVNRCYFLYPLAQLHDKLFEFCHSVAKGVWAEAADLRNDDDLKRLIIRAGLPWDQAKHYLKESPLISGSEASAFVSDIKLQKIGDWEEEVALNRAILMNDLGLWGVPCFQIGSFVAWGQDRIFFLEQYLLSLNEKSIKPHHN